MDKTTAYAVCLECGIEHADRAAMDRHMKESVVPVTDGGGVTARGHRQRVVNPTPEEVEASRLRRLVSEAIDDGVDRTVEHLSRAVDRGAITAEQVSHELRSSPDFADAWTQWCTEEGN